MTSPVGRCTVHRVACSRPPANLPTLPTVVSTGTTLSPSNCRMDKTARDHCEQQSVRHPGIIVTAACAAARLHPRASRLEFGRTPVVQSAIVTGVERHRATAALDACTSSKACFGGRGASSGCARCVSSHRLRVSMLRGAAASAAAPLLPSSGPSRAQVARLEWCPHHTQLFTSTNLPIPPGDQHRSVIPGRSTLELFPARPGFF